MKNLTSFLQKIPYPNQTVQLVDVGARWGANPPWDQVDKKFIKYLGFEADIEECKNLMSKYESSNVEYVPVGLADVAGDYILNLTSEPGCSSIYHPNHNFISQFFLSEQWDVVKKIPIKTVPLSQVLDEKALIPDVLKIDVQGAALKVLQGAGKYLSEVLFVEVEVEFSEMYEGEPLFSEVDRYMRQHGFELLDINKYYAKRRVLSANHSSRGQVLFADVYYVRSIKSFLSLNLTHELRHTRLWNLILILCVYGHFDYALEYAFNKESVLNEKEKVDLKKCVEEFTSLPKWKLLIFNNNFIEKIGFTMSVIANSLQVKSRLFGWGADQGAVDSRYKYHYRHPLLSLFRK